MLDGTDSALDGHSQTGAAEGVAHGELAQSGGLVYQRLHLVGSEGDVLGAVTLAGTGAAGGGELDDVGPDADHLPHHGADGLGAVGHSHGTHGVGGEGGAVA